MAQRKKFYFSTLRDLYIFLLNFESTQTARRNRVYLAILKHYFPFKAFSKSGNAAHLAEVAFKIEFSITCASSVQSNKNHVFVIRLILVAKWNSFSNNSYNFYFGVELLFVGCIDMYGNKGSSPTPSRAVLTYRVVDGRERRLLRPDAATISVSNAHHSPAERLTLNATRYRPATSVITVQDIIIFSTFQCCWYSH